MKFPAACASPSERAIKSSDFSMNWSRFGELHDPMSLSSIWMACWSKSVQSYREAIRETVQHFTGESVSHDLIQDFKNAGGWNNDWLLSHRLITIAARPSNTPTSSTDFNHIFLGENGDGLILKEHWMPRIGLLEKLSNHATLAIFTGRAKYEADATLGRYAAACALRSHHHRRISRQPEAGAGRPRSDQTAASRQDRSGISAIPSTMRAARKPQQCPSSVSPRRTIRATRKLPPVLRGLGAFTVLTTSTNSKLWSKEQPDNEGSHHRTQHQRNPDQRRPAHRRRRHLRNLHRHPLPGSHAGALHQAWRVSI